MTRTVGHAGVMTTGYGGDMMHGGRGRRGMRRGRPSHQGGPAGGGAACAPLSARPGLPSRERARRSLGGCRRGPAPPGGAEPPRSRAELGFHAGAFRRPARTPTRTAGRRSGRARVTRSGPAPGREGIGA